MLRLTVVALALCALAGAAQAQVPAGPEFAANSYTTAAQSRPDVAARPDGNFVVVWHGIGPGGTSYDVIGRLFSPFGNPIGPEFLVSSYTTGGQSSASVGADRNGGFVVTWQALNGAGVTNLFARRFQASGAPIGEDFAVNADTTFVTTQSAMAVHGDGRFVAVWQSLSRDGDGYGIFARRVDASGAPVGAEFQVNAYTTGSQRSPRAAMTPDGGFVVVWAGPDDFASGAWARRFGADGAPVGLEQPAATAAASQTQPAVAVAEDGSFVVAWTSYSQDGSHNGVFGRRFSPQGTPLGGEFRANSYTTDGQSFPRVAMAAAGGFVVAWDSLAQDGSQFGAFAQRFSATAAPRGAEFRLNTYTTDSQRTPVVATDAAGNFLTAWESTGQDGSGTGVFAQRYGGLAPVTSFVNGEDNGVVEVGDSFRFVTSWRNFTGAAQAIQGLSSSVVVPSGLFLGLSSVAVYPTIPNSAIVECLEPECFSGTLSGTRPLGHADLSFVETIAPEAQGQQKRWVLHVGESFSDVPRDNLFYSFIETLLHHAVTSGCGANVYCPASFTTREQMSVFVLVAKEGAGYGPPACATPVFTDVPASSAFCRWIEELARRGVVSGCAPGRYCPGDAVTREQMAVFVLRTLDPTLDPPACATPVFTDVPASSAFCRWIEELVRRGVVSGCAPGRYCPGDAVTREQMGVFISLTFGLALYGV